jgi:hypothetical protein
VLRCEIHLGAMVAEEAEHLLVVDLDTQGAEQVSGFLDDFVFEIVF